MDRFVAVYWKVANTISGHKASRVCAAIAAKNPGWLRAVDVPGFTLLVRPTPAGSTWSALPQGAGAIVGTVFQAASGTPKIARLDDPAVAQELLRSGGRTIISDYWGSYVAFFKDAGDDSGYAIRTPSGQIPCFHADVGELQLFFGDAEDLADLPGIRLDINWQHIGALLANPHVRTRETGFIGVTEVLPGECITLNGDKPSRAFYWRPDQISEDHIYDFGKAGEILHADTMRCISAWASQSKSVLLNLSGGFDSAVVLGCLREVESPPSIVCLNHFTRSIAGDERKYARAAALRAGVRLVEQEVEDEITVDLRTVLSNPKRVIRPSTKVFSTIQATCVARRSCPRARYGSGLDRSRWRSPVSPFCHGILRHRPFTRPRPESPLPSSRSRCRAALEKNHFGMSLVARSASISIPIAQNRTGSLFLAYPFYALISSALFQSRAPLTHGCMS